MENHPLWVETERQLIVERYKKTLVATSYMKRGSYLLTTDKQNNQTLGEYFKSKFINIQANSPQHQYIEHLVDVFEQSERQLVPQTF